METQAQFDMLRKDYKKRLKGLAASLKGTGSDRRSALIAAARVFHVLTSVAKEFNKSGKYCNRGYCPLPKSSLQAILSKYAPTALAILQVLHSQKIPLDRWMLAQFETLKNMPKFSMTLYNCYGLNAQIRYTRWETKQNRKLKHVEDRKSQTETLDRKVAHAIIKGHRQALSWTDVLKHVNPPSLIAALLYMYPQIPSWYCLAYDCFRELLTTGYFQDEYLLSCWDKYKRHKNIRETCERVLGWVTNKYGVLWQ